MLALQPCHGYELHQRLVSNLGQVWHISLSQAYSILNRLEGKGYIAGALEDQDKRPSRRRFQLTPSGEQRLRAWLDAPTPASVHLIRVEFTSRLYFACAISPDYAISIIDSQASEVRAGLQRLQADLDEIPASQLFNRLGLELRLRQLHSIAGWLESCRQACHNLPPSTTLLYLAKD
jgi:DNA-binding PadR family transcriptional regulator